MERSRSCCVSKFEADLSTANPSTGDLVLADWGDETGKESSVTYEQGKCLNQCVESALTVVSGKPAQ